MGMDRAEGLQHFYIRQSEQGKRFMKGWGMHCLQQQELFGREMDAAVRRIKEQLFKRHPGEEDICCYKCYEHAYAHDLGLRGMYLIMSRFEQGDFTGTDFTDCYAMESEWNDCRMQGTVWGNAKLFGAAFRNSDLRGADFRGAKLWNTDFTGSGLEGARFDRENQYMGNLNPRQRQEIIICL